MALPVLATGVKYFRYAGQDASEDRCFYRSKQRNDSRFNFAGWNILVLARCRRAGNRYETNDFNEIKEKVMKTRFLVSFLGVLFFSLESCSNDDEQSISIIGNWVNERQDTLVFMNNSLLEYRPYIPSLLPFVYLYEIKKDSITLALSYSSSLNNIKNYYFKYSDKQIEIHNFQYDGYDFYKPIK
ncbi:hypothetical protein FACS1894160_4930 [Bacteroidia bacterium]|nr:hypothetical protein FACS1894160_4930 [Bacteroidia bacterium]